MTFTLVALGISTIVVGAADVEGLNSARVPVSDRSDAEFDRGVSRALEIVIVKLTGNSASPQSGSGRAVVKQAKRLVQQFGYEQQGIGVASANELVLRVEFDARVLGEEMRSNRLALWGKERPETLVWLVLDDANGRNILEANDPHEIMRVMKDRARVRGIPIAFPVADIADTIALPDELSSVALANAAYLNSGKSGVQSTLVGHIRQVAPSLWESEWSLVVAGELIVWEQQGDIVELMVEESSDNLANELGHRYRDANQNPSDVVAVTVHGLRSVADYARTERYLSTIDSVTSLLVRQVDESAIIFDLAVKGGFASLVQSISFGQTLAPDPTDLGVFRLIPR